MAITVPYGPIINNRMAELQKKLSTIMLNMVLAPVFCCTHWLRPCNSFPHPAFGLIYEDAIGNSWIHLCCFKKVVLNSLSSYWWVGGGLPIGSQAPSPPMMRESPLLWITSTYSASVCIGRQSIPIHLPISNSTYSTKYILQGISSIALSQWII